MPYPLAFSLRLQPDRERLVVTPVGELDLCTAELLRGVLADAIDDGWRAVVVDLRSLTFLDSQGAHALLDARIAFDAIGARLMLMDGDPEACRVLELLDVRSAFSTAPPSVPV